MENLMLDIVIPTKNRLDRLKVCIPSIQEAIKELDYQTNIILFVDTLKDKEELLQIFNNIEVKIMEEEYFTSRFWNKYLKNMTSDILCYLSDDIKLDKNCLKNGLKALKDLKYDGVIGFYQENQKGKSNCNAAFGLISKKFSDRFPDNQAFCPEYRCFYSDEELMKYAQSIDRFIFCREAKLDHYHPVFTGQKPDETYYHYRRNKQRDVKIYNQRKARNLLWGREYILIED